MRKKFKNIDRHQYTWDGWTWAEFLDEHTIFQSMIQMRRQSKIQFHKYLRKIPKFSRSYIFGTGPSLDQAFQYDFSDGYRIVCNTIVKNLELLDHIKPHFIVAADPIHHFENNLHAHKFLLDLKFVLEKFDILLLTVDDYYPYLKYYYPSIAERTVPLNNDVNKISLNMKSELSYTNLHNILNSLLLPLGSSLANEIYLLGFDGRSTEDVLFWKNSMNNSYSRLKPCIQLAHPAFFKLMNFEEYAKVQSDSAELLMTMGEKIGKKYFCINETNIPSLKTRQLYR